MSLLHLHPDEPPARRVERHALVRAHNQTVVLDTFLRGVALSRVDVAEATGLSRPTVNVIVDQLERLGLLVRIGSRTGSVGRSAAVYRVNRLAGVVAAVVISEQQIRASLSDLDGVVVAQREIAKPGRGQLLRSVAELVIGLEVEIGVAPQSVRATIVSSPGAQDPVTGRLSLTENVPELSGVRLAAELSSLLAQEVVADMDVYLAAVGEHRFGCAQEVDTLGLLWVSGGIGFGMLVDGTPVRGAHGSAGEVGYLPLGTDPFASSSRRRGSLEEAAAAAGIRAATRRLRNEYPTQLNLRPSASDVLDAAGEGDPLGCAVVDEEAKLLAMTIFSVCVTLDPAAIVLGGDLGSHPVLRTPIERYLNELSPFPIDLRSSALGNEAVLLGAQAVGHDLLINRLLNSVAV
jgi:predicted NBD/HSP70 family sugar kinase